MPRKPKEKVPDDKHRECGDKTAWTEDQKEREYYYDDAHGYEVFDPSEESDDDDD